MGNAESLVEESHEDGLLEYPVYTKPASWRGHDVPPVLLSGDHGRDRRLAPRAVRTAYRRAPARPAAHAAARRLARSTSRSRLAAPADAGELFTLQRACWVQEQQANPGVDIPALHESLADVRAWLEEWTTLVLAARAARRLPSAAGRAA